MAGLATCIRKAGKALDRFDAEALKDAQVAYISDGVSVTEAGRNAVNDHLEALAAELKDVVDKAKAAGGDVSSVTGEPEALSGRRLARPGEVDPGPVRARLDDEDVKSIDADPTSPLSVVKKILATVEDQANYNPGVTQKIRDFAHNLGANSISSVLAFIPRRNLGDFVNRARMPSIEAHLRTASEMDGRRNQLLLEDEDLAKTWVDAVAKDPKGGDTTAELMHAATLAGVDPAEEYKPLKTKKLTEDDKLIDIQRRSNHEMLREYWDTLSPELQGIYRQVRDRYQERRKQVEDGLLSRIEISDADPNAKGRLVESLRHQFEAGRVQGPYFPLMRFGDFWGVAMDKDTGEVMSFAKFEKSSDQREWMASMRQHFNVDGGRKQKTDSITRQIDPSFAAKVTEAANAVDPKLADQIWQMYLDRLPEMSVRKAFMHRKGRAGFSTNAIRSFGHQMFHGAHQLAKLEYMHIMEGQIDTIYQEARAIEKDAATSGRTDDPDANWATPLADEVQRRFEWANNPATSPLSSKLTSLGFAWYLGAVPAAAAVNATQTPIVAFPVLAAEFNAWGAGKELLRAGKQWAGSRGNLADKLRGNERRAFDEAERIATFSKTQAADMAQLADGAQDYTSRGRKAAEMVAWMFQGVESGNRQATYLAAFRLAQARGDSFEDSVVLAHKLTYDSHFGYDNANRPRVMQGDIPKVAFLFRQYSVNMTYRLARDFRDGILRNPSISKSERSKAAQRFAGILGMTSIFAGTTGLPMIWAVSTVIDAMFGDEDEPFDTIAAVRTHLAEMFDETAATAIMKGPVDALTGITVSSRVSLNNLWVREAPENLEGADLAAFYFGEALGPIAKMVVVDPLVALKELRDGYGSKALEKLLPNQGKNLIKAMRYITEGVTNRQGEALVTKDELSKKDVFLQALGFPAQRVTQQYEENRAKMDAQTKILKRHTLLLDRLYLSLSNDDNKGVDEALDAIDKFNDANPEKAINTKTIMRSVATREGYRERAVGGITLDKDLDYLNDKYNFRGNRKDQE